MGGRGEREEGKLGGRGGGREGGMKEGMEERMEGGRNRGVYLRVFNKQKSTYLSSQMFLPWKQNSDFPQLAHIGVIIDEGERDATISSRDQVVHTPSLNTPPRKVMLSPFSLLRVHSLHRLTLPIQKIRIFSLFLEGLGFGTLPVVLRATPSSPRSGESLQQE